MPVPVAVAELVGTFLETLSYGLFVSQNEYVTWLKMKLTHSTGVYIVVFPRCLSILHGRNVSRGLMFYLLATMFISFILITMVSIQVHQLHHLLTYCKHLIVDLIRAFAAFTGNMHLPGSPEKYYANVDTALVMTKNASYVSTTLLSDALLVKRPACNRLIYSYCAIIGLSDIRGLGS